MRVIRLLGHPVILIIAFLLLIIEGDNFGGFFLLYLVLSIPHGEAYSLIAGIGIATIIIGFNLHKQYQRFLKPICYIAGYLLMILSLILSFEKGNKWETFHQSVPSLTFLIFAIFSFFYLITTIQLLVSHFIYSHTVKNIKRI